MAAYSLDSGKFGISSAVKRGRGTTILARAHLKHRDIKPEGRHCRPLPEPLVPRSRQPKVRGRSVNLVASTQLAQPTAADGQMWMSRVTAVRAYGGWVNIPNRLRPSIAGGCTHWDKVNRSRCWQRSVFGSASRHRCGSVAVAAHSLFVTSRQLWRAPVPFEEPSPLPRGAALQQCLHCTLAVLPMI